MSTFIASLVGSFQYFKLPEVWGALIVLLVVQGLFQYIIRRSTSPKLTQDAVGVGCLASVLSIFFQGFWVAMVVTFLLPELTGVGHLFSGQILFSIRAGIFAVLIVAFLSVSPWIGNWVASSPSLETLLLGTLTFRFLMPSYLNNIQPNLKSFSHLFPDFWGCLGYLILWFLLSRILYLFLMGMEKWPRVASKIKRKYLTILAKNLEIILGFWIFLAYAFDARQAVERSGLF